MLVIAAGGTGGHIMPALAIAIAWRDLGYPVVWFGKPDSLEQRIATKHHFVFYPIDACPLGSGLQIPWRMARLTKAMYHSRQWLKKLNAACVFSTGSFASFPTAMAASTMGIPLVIHEQNATMGFANKVLMRVATKVYLGMPIDHLPKHWVVGNPVFLKPKVSNGDKLLIFAGSQGSRFLNQQISVMLAKMKCEMPIIHIAGKGAESLQAYYDQTALDAVVYDFVYDMDKIYRQAKLVVCRSGAMSLAEISGYGIPAILVPFPYAADDHQRKNAQVFSKQGAALVVEEDIAALQQALIKLQDQHRQTRMRDAMLQLQPQNTVQKIISGMKELYAQALPD